MFSNYSYTFTSLSLNDYFERNKLNEKEIKTYGQGKKYSTFVPTMDGYDVSLQHLDMTFGYNIWT